MNYSRWSDYMQAHLWMARHLLDSRVLLLMLPLVFTVLKIGGEIENELVKRLAEKKKEKKEATHG